MTLVTGAKSGLGKATAEYFIQNGSKVISYDLPYDYGIMPADRENCMHIAGDVSNEPFPSYHKSAANYFEKILAKILKTYIYISEKVENTVSENCSP